jgi:hypothetical protein
MNRSQLRYTRDIYYSLPIEGYTFDKKKKLPKVRIHYLTTDIERQAIGIYTPEDLLILYNGSKCPVTNTAVLYVDNEKDFDYEVTSITPYIQGIQITARKRVR